MPGSICPHVTLGGGRRGTRGNDKSRRHSQLKAWHCSVLWGEFGVHVAQKMQLKGVPPSSCHLFPVGVDALSTQPGHHLPLSSAASSAAACVSFQRGSPQWWDSPRGFPFPLLSSDPPHMSRPRSRGLCPPTCPRTAPGPTCHQVSPAGGHRAGDWQQLFPAALGSWGHTRGAWGCSKAPWGGLGGTVPVAGLAPSLYSKGGVAAGWGRPQ